MILPYQLTLIPIQNTHFDVNNATAPSLTFHGRLVPLYKPPHSNGGKLQASHVTLICAMSLSCGGHSESWVYHFTWYDDSSGKILSCLVVDSLRIMGLPVHMVEQLFRENTLLSCGSHSKSHGSTTSCLVVGSSHGSTTYDCHMNILWWTSITYHYNSSCSKSVKQTFHRIPKLEKSWKNNPLYAKWHIPSNVPMYGPQSKLAGSLLHCYINVWRWGYCNTLYLKCVGGCVMSQR